MLLSRPNWPLLFSSLKKITKDFTLPYVSELAARGFLSTQERAYAVLVSTIISLRTRDQTTKEATERLLKIAPTLAALKKTPLSKIEKALYPAGFYKTKAKQMKSMAEILFKEQGEIPNSLEQLIALPGVGRKTANLVLTEGFDLPGICVDVHVHRILNRLGYLKTKTPDDTETWLRVHLPKRYWKSINFYLVMFGQNHCKPVSPKCESCLIRTKLGCGFAQG